MKRLAIFTLLICSLLLITVSADTRYAFEIEHSDVEYSYTGINDEEASVIIGDLFGNNSYITATNGQMTMQSIFCVFGHSKQGATITQTAHSYYTTSPKCKELTSYVEYCTRSGCDYYTVLSQYENRIGCH